MNAHEDTIRAALATGRRGDKLLSGRDFMNAPWVRALAALDALVAENARLAAELAEAERQRDGAAECLTQFAGERDEALRVADGLREALDKVPMPSDSDPRAFWDAWEAATAARSSEGQPRDERAEWTRNVQRTVDLAHVENLGGKHRSGFCEACADANLVAQRAFGPYPRETQQGADE